MSKFLELTLFFKNVMISLACCNHLDFRNNFRRQEESRLLLYVKENDNNIETAIHQVVFDLIRTDTYQEFCATMEIRSKEKKEICDDLFVFAIDFVGLYNTFRLHPDVVDEFKNNFSLIF